MALFEGATEEARTYTDAALTRIGHAIDGAERYAVDVEAPRAGDRYVAFDTSFTVLDTFAPASTTGQGRAGSHGDANGKGGAEGGDAASPLDLAEEDVAVSAGLLPVHYAERQIAEAARLIGEGDFYEANLALKAVDDALVVHTFAVDVTPRATAAATAEAGDAGAQS
jgi:hypothetical protein